MIPTAITKTINPRTVGRLSLYRRVLNDLTGRGVKRVFSRDLAILAGVSASQVRQDLMHVASHGTPQNGYSVASLRTAVDRCLGPVSQAHTVLLGAGHLGRALLHFFKATRQNLKIEAILEVNPDLIGHQVHDVPVYHEESLEDRVRATGARTAILALPDEVAQAQTDRLVAAGVVSILNFTRIRLQVPAHVYVEDNDIQMSVERVSYYAAMAERKRERGD
ncbi:redox-sensing transcriptional repressor Rex [bacterium DOLZORAL124_64_63]|nr:MAG: redox-sensing transcriptional repressor Rex [bacterium DOLZORAL124_64_63]